MNESEIVPASAVVPAPVSMAGASEVPAELQARFVRAGFAAEVAPDGKLRVSRTGHVFLRSDPGAEAMPVDMPIEGQELRNLSGIVAGYEASLAGG